MTAGEAPKAAKRTGNFKDERDGKELRQKTPRESHDVWEPPGHRRHPIEILQESNKGRIPDLIPIRYGRMAQSPFAFFRGAAALMAADLSHCPSTETRVQSCGDCHLMNFGIYATPERNLAFDINDFDETLPAPFEWDLKRLAVSLVLSARHNGFKASVCKEIARKVVRSYRLAIRQFSEMRALEVWYAKFDVVSFIENSTNESWKKFAKKELKKLSQRNEPSHFYPRFTTMRDGKRMIKDDPPLIFHDAERLEHEDVVGALSTYRETLQHDRRVLLDRYKICDEAVKVVGIGSVGTICGVMLLLASDDDPLVLQFKEARTSVLEPYAGKSVYENSAQRVVEGQRLMQAASDIFLGWTKGKRGRHFYIRQLRDMKYSLRPEMWVESQFLRATEAMGWVLARAHARSADTVQLRDYMGGGDVLDRAIATFAIQYADQTERDHAELLKAIRTGKVEAYFER